MICGLLLASCSTTFNAIDSYHYNEILIVNNSRALIRDVTISAGAGGRSFSCSNIAPLGICADKFPRRRYMRSPIQIAWIFGNAARQTREFVLEVPATFHTSLALRGVLEISAEGSISAFFEQDSPNN